MRRLLQNFVALASVAAALALPVAVSARGHGHGGHHGGGHHGGHHGGSLTADTTVVIMVAVITRITGMVTGMDIITRMRAVSGMGSGTATEWVPVGSGRAIMTSMSGSAPDQQEAIRRS